MARVLVDTSAVFALVDSSDHWHAAAKAGLDSLKKARSEPLLTNFIVAECGATAADVLRLIDLIRDRVHRVFATELELEIDVWQCADGGR